MDYHVYVQKKPNYKIKQSTQTRKVLRYMYELLLIIPRKGHPGIEETDQVASMSTQNDPG